MSKHGKHKGNCPDDTKDMDHMKIYSYLISRGPTMHGTPGMRKGKSS